MQHLLERHPRPPVQAAARAFAASLRALPRFVAATAAVAANPGGPTAPTLPPLFQGSFAEALASASTRGVPLLVFLHSELHEDAEAFAVDTLCDPQARGAAGGAERECGSRPL